jgi:hypothetical protein
MRGTEVTGADCTGFDTTLDTTLDTTGVCGTGLAETGVPWTGLTGIAGLFGFGPRTNFLCKVLAAMRGVVSGNSALNIGP